MMLNRLAAGQSELTQGNCRLLQRPANFRNAVIPLRVTPKLSRTLTRSMDRNMIACVALASQELTRNAPPIVEAGSEVDSHGITRLPLRREGWNFWEWEGRKIHYITAGDKGTPLLLIHGFGASAYHWRYNINELAKTHRVFAVDLLGFGWSDKPLVEYSKYDLWPRQLSTFINEVIGEPAVVAGNSLGGYASLATAVRYPETVKGVVLLNAAGRFEEVKAEAQAQVEAALPSTEAGQGAKEALREASGVEPESSNGNPVSGARPTGQSLGSSPASTSGRPAASAKEEMSLLTRITAPFKELAMRGTIYTSFVFAKQPKRIRQVLQQVYKNMQNIDDELVNSIVWPAQGNNAAEVFYRIITGEGTPVNVLLNELDKVERTQPFFIPARRFAHQPVLLLWGADDPWIRPQSAERIRSLYPRAEKVLLPGVGHCPQDDAPERVNEELLKWVATI